MNSKIERRINQIFGGLIVILCLASVAITIYDKL